MNYKTIQTTVLKIYINVHATIVFDLIHYIFCNFCSHNFGFCVLDFNEHNLAKPQSDLINPSQIFNIF